MQPPQAIPVRNPLQRYQWRPDMKKLLTTILAGALGWSAQAQPASPAVTPLTAYSGSLNAPFRIATDPYGNMFVTEPKAGQVVVLDSAGRQRAIRTGLGKPLGIALDRNGVIYLTDETSGSVSVYDSDWRQLYKLGAGDKEFQLPNHLALGTSAEGTTVYVSDSKANKIKMYRGQSLIGEFGTFGTGNGQFDFPAGLCISAAGEVFVVDQNNDRVQVFDSSGGFIRGFSLGSSSPGGRGQAALLDSALRLYVADAYQGVLKVFDAGTGAMLGQIGTFGESPGQLSSPGGLAMDNFGRLWVASANNQRVEVYGLDGFLHVSANILGAFVPAGTNLVLSAMFGSQGSTTVQWQRNGQDIPGATNAGLTVTNVGAADSGNYSVVLTSSSGVITSSITGFTVLAPAMILAGPESQVALRGADVLMHVQASGSSLGYQWLFNGRTVDGATESALQLPAVQPYEAGDYSVIVSNDLGGVSATAQLQVLTPPSIMEIVSAFNQPNQGFHLTLNVDPGFSYALEASTNFNTWEPLISFANEAGLFEFTDAESTNFWSRFYRIRWEP